uniref:Uncharacterized protein n=1 Tax=Rhizophora mucronata TaxID=61149 RepID=A0A2P2QW27_RHIMU
MVRHSGGVWNTRQWTRSRITSSHPDKPGF